MMKFYRQHSAEQTYREAQREDIVTTQFALMMFPWHWNIPEPITDT
jgi:hypothetical protein